MKIAVDVMGFEGDVSEAIRACKRLVKKYLELEIILVGNEKEISEKMGNCNRLSVVDSSEVVTQNDQVITALRKKNSSMAKAIDLVIENKADAIVSAGSTPCFVAMTHHKIGMIKNISKPAFMPFLPTTKRKTTIWMDVGANKTCDSDDLVNFSLMGSVASSLIFGNNNPEVALLNIGTEEHKGLDHITEANNKLKQIKKINYIGYVEPRELLEGVTDVAISDGFTGNIALKSLEGAMKTITNELKKGFKKPYGWLGGLFSLPVIKGIKKTFDYKNNAGAIVMGLKYLAVKTHGSADEAQFFSAIEIAIKCVKNNLINKIKEVING